VAHFIGAVQGSRAEATRLGGPSSGIRTVARGWNVGVNVQGRKEDDGDVFTIYADSGSNGRTAGMYIGTVKLIDGKITFTLSDQLRAVNCVECDGKGEIETGIGMMRCDSCNGSGRGY